MLDFLGVLLARKSRDEVERPWQSRVVSALKTIFIVLFRVLAIGAILVLLILFIGSH